jgi:hypothetical protein
VSPSVVEALQFQLAGVRHRSLSSPLYAALLEAAIDDVGRAGPVAAVLAEVPEDLDPIPDAVVLRFLGGLHRLVLRGELPDLARWFGTAGGRFDPAEGDSVNAAQADFLAAVAGHTDALVASLGVGVQTNEVARCATLAVGFTEVLRRTGLPLRLLELGSSAGLNLRWDHWRYESGPTAWGDPSAALRFATNYHEPWPDLGAPLGPSEAVASRAGCDRSPIDPTTDEGRLLLRSFVWPDQPDRHERLDAALAAAAATPVRVEAGDAGEWVRDRLGEPARGTATVVFHSIVWQYLPPSTRHEIVGALTAAGAAASTSAPLFWLRMEPGADLAQAAEVRLQGWPGGDDELLAWTGYHGHPVWAAEPA